MEDRGTYQRQAGTWRPSPDVGPIAALLVVWVPGGLLQVAGQSSVFSYSLVPWRIGSLNEVLLNIL